MPTPDVVCAVIASKVDLRNVYCLDPCCGAGTALQITAPEGYRYGVELELDRAEAAKDKLLHVASCALQDARISRASFGFMLLNPPYSDSVDGRLEMVFLERCSRYLVPNGILAFIIPESRFDTPIRKFIRRHYDVLSHDRFPVGYYDGPKLPYRQTLMIAAKRSIPVDIDDADDWNAEWFDQIDSMPLSSAVDTSAGMVVPKGQPPLMFCAGKLREEDIAKLLYESPLSRRMEVPSMKGCGRPPLPLKQGHQAQALASGLMNGVVGDGELRHIAKGTVVRQTLIEKFPDPTQGGRAAIIERETNTFTIKVRALMPNGTIHDMVGAIDREEQGAADAV